MVSGPMDTCRGRAVASHCEAGVSASSCMIRLCKAPNKSNKLLLPGMNSKLSLSNSACSVCFDHLVAPQQLVHYHEKFGDFSSHTNVSH